MWFSLIIPKSIERYNESQKNISLKKFMSSTAYIDEEWKIETLIK